MEQFPLTAKKSPADRTLVNIGALTVGEGFTVIAGPCAVESREQIMSAARAVRAAGAQMLRGGAFKTRTSPYTFQGLGEEGLRLLRDAGDAVGLPTVTEVTDAGKVALTAAYADVLQIGARNMQNTALLQEAGRAGKPVILKRGFYATVEEWLLAAEYVMAAGCGDLILCERGIRTFDRDTRNTLDLGAVAAVKMLTHLPVIVDPSHATGRADLVCPMALSAVMAGADGLMIEVHPTPDAALSDEEQQLSPESFARLMGDIEKTVEFKRSLDG